MMLWQSKNPVVKALGYLIVWLTPNCQEMTRLISRAMEEPLPFHKRMLMKLHYYICVWCERFETHIRFLRDAARRFDEHAPVARLSAEAKSRIKAEVKRHV